MSQDDFVKLVQKLRESQKRWFREKRPQDLDDSKALERQVDRALADLARPPSLFDSMS